MLRSTMSYGGMVTAPHHLAAQAGRRVLAEGGNAIEAMIAAASTIAVVYPHMNALGGDNFWLIAKPGQEPTAIDACGGAAGTASIDFYSSQGLQAIPSRGPQSALTVAGAVSGWQAAHELSQQQFGGKMPLSRKNLSSIDTHPIASREMLSCRHQLNGDAGLAATSGGLTRLVDCRKGTPCAGDEAIGVRT